MIATMGYDGFLYSIGYLAGWVVALFVVAEPMKRMGKYTFTDALDSKFNSKNIQLMAAISTLIVSVCYLIPQMVGAGALSEPSPEYRINSTLRADGYVFAKLEKDGIFTWWKLSEKEGKSVLEETLSITKQPDGSLQYNGEPKGNN